MCNSLQQATFHSIGDGPAAGLDAVHRMRELVRDQCALPLVRETAVRIAHGTGIDAAQQAARIRAWLSRHVGFIRDPFGIEGLTEPVAQLLWLQNVGWLDGDCDDVATLGAALGQAIGLPARFVLLGRLGGFEHVWAELGDPLTGAWYDLDITRPFQPDFSHYDPPLAVEV